MPGKVIVYGGKGGLGIVVVDTFKAAGYWVLSVDLAENPAADSNLLVSLSANWTEQEAQVCQGVEAALGGDKVEAVINVAGGWAGGNAGDADWIKNADLMWKQSVWSSTVSGTLAAKFLSGTPGMIGYGMAKAAVHQLVKSLASSGSGLPTNSCVLGLLPITLDTPMNRKFMSGADTSTWTPLSEVGKIMLNWTAGEQRFQSGSLVALVTSGGVTRLEAC